LIFAALQPHFFDIPQRGELLTGNHFDCEISARNFAAETGHGHTTARKSEFHSISKAKRCIAGDLIIVSHSSVSFSDTSNAHLNDASRAQTGSPRRLADERADVPSLNSLVEFERHIRTTAPSRWVIAFDRKR